MEGSDDAILMTSFKQKLVGSKIDFYVDDNENVPMVCFADLVAALVRNSDPTKIIDWENDIMEEDQWYAQREDPNEAVFLTLEHCGDALQRFLNSSKAIEAFKEWEEKAYDELDEIEKRKSQRKGQNSKFENAKKRRTDADWIAFVHNRKRRKKKQQQADEEYRPSPEDDDAWALDMLVDAMSEEEEEQIHSSSLRSLDVDIEYGKFNSQPHGQQQQPEKEAEHEDEDPIEEFENSEKDADVLAPDSQPEGNQLENPPRTENPNHLEFVQVNHMSWSSKKDFVSFHMQTVKALRETWTTFKDVDPQIAGSCMTMITNSLRAIEPYWPAQHTQSTSHQFVNDQDDPRDPPVSISQRLNKYGYDPAKIPIETFKRIGALAARLYENEYGTRPETIHRQYEGQWRAVNKYKRSRARKTIDVAIKRVLG